MNIYIMVGLPASGKSTLSRRLYDVNKFNTVVYSPDNLRDMVTANQYKEYPFDTGFSFILEDMFDSIFDIMLDKVVKEGFNLIVDEVNINAKKRLKMLKKIEKTLKKHNKTANIYYFHINTHINKCLKRCKAGRKGIEFNNWQRVITNMNKYEINFSEDIKFINTANRIKIFEIKHITEGVCNEF